MNLMNLNPYPTNSLPPPIPKKLEKKFKKRKQEVTLTEFIPFLSTKNWKDRLFIGIQIAEGIRAYHVQGTSSRKHMRSQYCF